MKEKRKVDARTAAFLQIFRKMGVSFQTIDAETGEVVEIEEGLEENLEE